MTAEVIQHMLDQSPFTPFRVCLSNGESYEVRNPHMVALMKSKAFIALPHSERWAFVSYLHIAALESISDGHPPGGASKRKRRR